MGQILQMFLVLGLVSLAVVFIALIMRFRTESRLVEGSENAAGQSGYVLHDEGYHPVLSEKFPFYNTLDAGLKKKFCRRVEAFLSRRVFEGREGFEVTHEARILLSAAAVRLTLGLKDYMLSEFHTILIYPDIFYSRISETHNRGETNPHGVIVFSWPHVVDGFRTVEDHINLAYHEFAHALLLQNSTRGIKDGAFYYGYQIFNHALLRKHLSQEVRHMGIFREYAFTNKMEFFAVAIEHFMEAPEYLYEKCRELYDILVRMLRQDPVRQLYGLHFYYGDEFWIEYNTDPEDEP